MFVVATLSASCTVYLFFVCFVLFEGGHNKQYSDHLIVFVGNIFSASDDIFLILFLHTYQPNSVAIDPCYMLCLQAHITMCL